MTITYMTRKDEGLGEGLYDSIAWAFEVHICKADTKEFNFAIAYENNSGLFKIELWRKEPQYNTPADFIWTALD